MKKKVLVPGGTGAMGVYLVPELLKMGYQVDVTERRTTPPLVPTQATWDYVERMKAVAERTGLPFGLIKRGGLSDANHMSDFCEVCVDSLGPTGDFDHSDREYLRIETIEPSTRFAYELICDLAEER